MESKETEIGSLYSNPSDIASEYLGNHPQLREKIGIDMAIDIFEMGTIRAADSETNARLQTVGDALTATTTPMDIDSFFDPEFLGYILSRNRERFLNLNPNIDREKIDKQGLQDFLAGANVGVAVKLFGKTTHGSADSIYTFLTTEDREMLVPLYVSLNKHQSFSEAAGRLLEITEKRFDELPSLKDRFEGLQTRMATLIVQPYSTARNEKMIDIIQEFYEEDRKLDATDTVQDFESLGLSITDSKLISVLGDPELGEIYRGFQTGIRYPEISSDNKIFEEIYENISEAAGIFNNLEEFKIKVLEVCRTDLPKIAQFIDKQPGEKDTDYLIRLRETAEESWNAKQNKLRKFIHSKDGINEVNRNPEAILNKINEILGMNLVANHKGQGTEEMDRGIEHEELAAAIEGRQSRVSGDKEAYRRRTTIAVPAVGLAFVYRYTDGECTISIPIDEAIERKLMDSNTPQLTAQQYSEFSNLMLVMGRA